MRATFQRRYSRSPDLVNPRRAGFLGVFPTCLKTLPGNELRAARQFPGVSWLMAGRPSVSEASAHDCRARFLAVPPLPSGPDSLRRSAKSCGPPPRTVLQRSMAPSAPLASALRDRRQPRGRHPVEQEMGRIAREETGGGASEEVADGIEGPARSARAGRGLPRWRAGRGSRLAQRGLNSRQPPDAPEERSPAGEHSMANAAVSRAGGGSNTSGALPPSRPPTAPPSTSRSAARGS